MRSIVLALAFGLGALAMGCSAGGDPAAAMESAATAASPMEQLVGKIEAAVGGRDFAFDVAATPLTGDTNLDLLKSFIASQNRGDNRLLGGYAYAENETDFHMDEQKAGLFAPASLEGAINGALENWFSGQDRRGGVPAMEAKIKDATEKLAAAGAIFGYDGFGQNGCAAPTALLIIIDPATKTGWAVDLNPCSRS